MFRLHTVRAFLNLKLGPDLEQAYGGEIIDLDAGLLGCLRKVPFDNLFRLGNKGKSDIEGGSVSINKTGLGHRFT